MATRPVVVWVDPAAGQKGMHNLGFVDLLMQEALPGSVDLALAAHQELDPGRSTMLRARGVEVIGIFGSDVYQFADELPGPDRMTPFNVQLAAEFGELFRRASLRWPGRAVHFVFHSMSWLPLRALSAALASGAWPQPWRFHVFFAYWPGTDVDGEVVNHPLMLRYKMGLSALSRRPDMRWYTSSNDYLRGFRRLLGDAPVAVHPFFLGQWNADVPEPEAAPRREMQRILVYAGDIRPIKGFGQVPDMIEDLLQRFPSVTHLLVQMAAPVKSLKGNLRSAGMRLAELEARLPVLQVSRGFADSMTLMEMVASSDLIVLNYDADAYRYKTSGFLWMAAQLGVRCAVTADTWLEREARRLGMAGWSIEWQGKGLHWKPLHPHAGPEVHAYRQQVLQPLNPWMAALEGS